MSDSDKKPEATYIDNDGQEYRAVIVRMYEQKETVPMGGGKFRAVNRNYADLRVFFGKHKTAINARGVPESVEEWLPVHGVSMKGDQFNSKHSRCFIPAEMSDAQRSQMSDNLKSRAELLAELRALKARGDDEEELAPKKKRGRPKKEDKEEGDGPPQFEDVND